MHFAILLNVVYKKKWKLQFFLMDAMKETNAKPLHLYAKLKREADYLSIHLRPLD